MMPRRETVDVDPSWSNRERKPRPSPHISVCGCGKIHAFRDDRGELQTCNHCCKRHEWRMK